MKRVILNIVSSDLNDGYVQNSKSTADFLEWVNCDLVVVTDSLPCITKAEIIDIEANIGGTLFAQGSLKLSTKKFADEVFAKINNKGHLQIFGKNIDRYFVNSNGHLIYKYCND